MSDPHVVPKGETPIERRERLLNLTNEAWVAPPPHEDEEAPKAPAPESAVTVEGVADGGVTSNVAAETIVGEAGPEKIVKPRSRPKDA